MSKASCVLHGWDKKESSKERAGPKPLIAEAVCPGPCIHFLLPGTNYLLPLGLVERLDWSGWLPALPPGVRPMLPDPEEPEPEVAEEPPEAPPPLPSCPQPARRPDTANATAAANAVTFMLTSMVGNALVREQGMDREGVFTQIVLYTGSDGRARFKEQPLALREGTPQARLSAILPATGYQLRHSPVGFASGFHCTPQPQWVFILAGEMEIGLQDGSSRRFLPGEHFFSADVLPGGATFDPGVHGHRSAQRGPDPLVTLFLKV